MSNHYLTNDLTSRCYLSIRLLNRTQLLILLLTEKQRVLVKAKVDNNYYNVAVATHDINLNMVNIEKVRRK
jgi:hypothetical protein